MGDEDDRREFIDSNLPVLTKSTHIGFELVIGLYSRKLITEEEKDLLKDDRTPNIIRAAMLYTKIANKWSQRQFEDFKTVLKDTRNYLALQVFTNAGADVFLTNEQVQLLREQIIITERGGCYEGLSYQTETMANKVVRLAKGDGIFKNGKLNLNPELDRREVVHLVKHFVKNLKNNVIWFNPKKQQLETNQIQKHDGSHNTFDFNDPYPSELKKSTLMEVTEDRRLALLLVPPESEESSFVSQLEQGLRKNILLDRVVIFVNLHDIQFEWSTFSKQESSSSVLMNLAPFLPKAALHKKEVSVFVFLDVLDEVWLSHQDTIINILRIFKSSEEPISGLSVVVKIGLNHIDRVKSEFNFKPWSLHHLDLEKPQNCIKNLGVYEGEPQELNGRFSQSSLKLNMPNPIMLLTVANFLKIDNYLSSADLHIYHTYSLFINVSHCLNTAPLREANDEDITSSALKRYLPFYYHVALKDLLNVNCTSSPAFIESLRSVTEDPHKTSTNSGSNEYSMLLRYGLFVEDKNKQLVFKHRSFAEFFYAMLLTQKNTPQVIKDTLFGNIYLENTILKTTATFIGAGLLFNRVKTGSSFLSISTKFLLINEDINRCQLLVNLTEGSLFPLVAQEVLNTFVDGDLEELWIALCVLVDSKSVQAFANIFKWMVGNRDWTRQNIFKIQKTGKNTVTSSEFSLTAARLIVAVALRFNNQSLITEPELSAALNSCWKLLDHRTPESLKFELVELGHNSKSKMDKYLVIHQNKIRPKNNFNKEISSVTYNVDRNLVVYPENWEDKLVSNRANAPNNATNKIADSSILGLWHLLQSSYVYQKRSETETNPDYNKFCPSIPTLRDFVHFAEISYQNNAFHLNQEQDHPAGFSFLASGSNSGIFNGYYGIAYINERNRQIILSHRGTDSYFKPWITNILSIKYKKFTQRVSSAITFSHTICDFAKKNNCEVFFTGHSLGGWLAQVTCFTSMYMTISQDSNKFVGLQPPYAKSSRPFTAAFDSPGAFDFLLSLKQSFPQSVHRDVNIDHLPCEVYLFHQNLINFINFQVGTVFLINLGKDDEVVNTNRLGYYTHSIETAANLIRKHGEDAIKWRLIDYRVTAKDLFKKSSITGADGRNVGPWDTNSFSKSFFNEIELKFLSEVWANQNHKGQFEGLQYQDEETANWILKSSSEFEGSEVLLEWKRRLEFIPKVRRTLKCIEEGTLWWNPSKQSLPETYCPRMVYNSRDKKEEAFCTLMDLVGREKFVFLVGDPGMGKSSAMTKLEEDLRQSTKNHRRVILRLNLNNVQDLLDQATELNFESFFETFFPYINSSQVLYNIQFGQYPLYLILDGLDEVCPTYTDKMRTVIQAILSTRNSHSGKYVFLKLVLTTRPHLQNIIEQEFKVISHSLSHITQEQQAYFLFKQVTGLFSNEEDVLNGISDTMKSLMSNPLMLNMYSEVLLRAGTENKFGDMDIFTLYSRFMVMKHELQAVEKEKAERAANSTKTRVQIMFQDNLPFYGSVAVNELLTQEQAQRAFKIVL